MRDGTQIVVPASLRSITTYVLLEQEQWFEKEISFLARWLKPGMNVIDIGANLGVYSLPMARSVGPAGIVYAYEPASKTREFLQSSKEKNGVDNLQIIAAAVSDAPRQGHLVFGDSSELNTLEGSGPGETITITSLNNEQAARNFPPIDFLKIDAEGEEARILDGSTGFLDRHSPLIMFEVKGRESHHEGLSAQLRERGFNIYRQLGSSPVLIPTRDDEPIEYWELNYFAAKPDRARQLVEDGVLVETIWKWHASGDVKSIALENVRAQPFAATMGNLLSDASRLDSKYAEGLAAFAAWRTESLPLSERVGALLGAYEILHQASERQPTLARLSTFARVAIEAGHRLVSIVALSKCVTLFEKGSDGVREPFWPANARFDTIPVGENPIFWFVVGTIEQIAKTENFSSYFGVNFNLDWLSAQSLAATEIERRSVLRKALAGNRVPISKRLSLKSPEHLNGEIWKAGLVPNTTTGA